MVRFLASDKYIIRDSQQGGLGCKFLSFALLTSLRYYREFLSLILVLTRFKLYRD